MDLQALLAAIAPFGGIGLSIVDSADPSTWVLQGVSEANLTAAREALRAVLHPPAPSASTFWPAAPSALELQVKALQTRIGV